MSLPIDPRTGEPLPPREQPGYYPGYSTLGQQNFWDAATRQKILQRVQKIPPIRFFKPAEKEILEVVAAHILPQDDRIPERRIPIVPRIDERLFLIRLPGYRFEEMPPDQKVYRLGLRAIERIAQRSRKGRFLQLSWREQEEILKSVRDSKPPGGAAHIWKKMSIKRFWDLLVHDCLEVYYSHPSAWDEIGFGGPAYPRAYVRLEKGIPESWEVEEKRYEWAAPNDSLSDSDIGKSENEKSLNPGENHR